LRLLLETPPAWIINAEFPAAPWWVASIRLSGKNPSPYS